MFAVDKYGHLEVTACASVAYENNYSFISAESMKHLELPPIWCYPHLPY